MKQILIKKSDVKILGAGILSCVNQIALVGQSGEEIYETIGIKSIDPKKKYSYNVRSLIIEEVLRKYGDVGVYALGLGQTDSFTNTNPEIKKMFTAKLKMEKDIKTNTKNEYEALKYFVKVYINYINSALKNLFNTSKKYRAQFIWINNTSGKLVMDGAFNYRHSEILRGAQTEILMRYLSNYWDIKLEHLSKETKLLTHGCTFVFYIDFKRNHRQEDSFLLAEKHKHEVTRQFLKKVIQSANQKNKEIEKISSKLSKYIPPQVHEALFSGKYDTEISTRRKKLTIFFSDIANFTSTSEGLQPEDLTKYLNEYFSEMTKIALDYGATIDKYIGDAMMVFFGDPESKGEREDARACVEMALRMQERMEELREKWLNEGFADPFQIRIGLNTGYCNVGNFGSDQRLTYTIIGGEVNVAQRLEASADANGILMSYETYAHAQDMIEVEERDAIKMKGISREIKVYSVTNRKGKANSKTHKIQKKPSKKELSQTEKLEKDMLVMKNNIEVLNKKMEVVLKKL